MIKYNKKEYLKYINGFNKDGLKDCRPISFKKWKVMQPIADRMVGKVNKIIKNK